jgi:hypothetical protein
MSISHQLEIGGDANTSLHLNISGVDNGGNQVGELEFSIYAVDRSSGSPIFTCELSLEEIQRLQNHFSKYSVIVDANVTEVGKFVAVTDGTEALVQIMEAAVPSDLLPALKNLASNQLSKEDIETILGRKDALEEYALMLDNPDDYSESDWQAFFERQEWIFGYGLKYQYLQIIQREAYVSGTTVGGGNAVISDFLLSDNRFTKLVELKTPRTKLFEARRNRSDSWRLSTDLTDAVSQILAQKANWEIEATTRNHDSEGNLIQEGASDVECLLVIGDSRLISGTDHAIEIKRKTIELYRRNLRNIEILFYDELYERAKFIVEGSSDTAGV